MRIVIGGDHGGLPLKVVVRDYLAELGHEIVDVGAHTEESVDYPDFAKLVAEMVAGGEAERGVVVCGTGIGVSIAANKIPGVRAALCTDGYMARMARAHNDANVLALGGRVIGSELAKDIVDAFLKTAYEGGRHQRRLDKIKALEK
jgi:ribose 5-phosphate isomerase B